MVKTAVRFTDDADVSEMIETKPDNLINAALDKLKNKARPSEISQSIIKPPEIIKRETKPVSIKEDRPDIQLPDNLLNHIKPPTEQIKQQPVKPAPVIKQSPAPIRTIDNDDNEGIIEATGLDRRKLITKIEQYKLLFPDILKGFRYNKTLNANELTEILDEVAWIVSNDGATIFIEQSILSLIEAGEHFAYDFTGEDLRGLARVLSQNAEFKKVCNEISLKYGLISQCSDPVLRLFFIVGVNAFAVRQMNKEKVERNLRRNKTE